jgi:hypothetical protein
MHPTEEKSQKTLLKLKIAPSFLHSFGKHRNESWSKLLATPINHRKQQQTAKEEAMMITSSMSHEDEEREREREKWGGKKKKWVV